MLVKDLAPMGLANLQEITGIKPHFPTNLYWDCYLSFRCYLSPVYPVHEAPFSFLSLLEAHGQEVSDFQDMIELNPYAVQYRYGAFDEISGFIDHMAVVSRVHELVASVDLHISPKNQSPLARD